MKFSRGYFLFALVLIISFLDCQVVSAQGSDYFMYFGTYTGFKFVTKSKTIGVGDSHSEGIYVSRLNAATGEMGEPQLAAKVVNPAFLTVNPNHRFLYAVTEDPLSVGPPLDHSSYVSAFAIDHASGKLRLLNALPTGGTSTCQISIDKTGKFIFLANFGSGSISVMRVKDDGSLGEQTAFMQHIGRGGSDLPIQSSAHPHSVVVSPDNRYAIASDLGLDKVFIYHFDAGTGGAFPAGCAFRDGPCWGRSPSLHLRSSRQVWLFVKRDGIHADRFRLGRGEGNADAGPGSCNQACWLRWPRRSGRDPDQQRREISLRVQPLEPQHGPASRHDRRVRD